MQSHALSTVSGTESLRMLHATGNSWIFSTSNQQSFYRTKLSAYKVGNSSKKCFANINPQKSRRAGLTHLPWWAKFRYLFVMIAHNLLSFTYKVKNQVDSIPTMHFLTGITRNTQIYSRRLSLTARAWKFWNNALRETLQHAPISEDTKPTMITLIATYQAVPRNRPLGWKVTLLTLYGACPSMSAIGSSESRLHSLTAPDWSQLARFTAAVCCRTVASGWNVIHDVWHGWPTTKCITTHYQVIALIASEE